MMAITKDCKTVLVALEGEVYVDNGTVIDPEGGKKSILKACMSLNIIRYV
jgi:hypothetical protein